MMMPSRPLQGILWMMTTGLCFIAVTAVVKHAGQTLPAPQAAFLRYLLGVVFLLPFVRGLLVARMTRRDAAFFMGRGVVHTIAVMLWFFAMTQIPIAEVTAMNYLNPVYVTLGAAIFLGERLALRRILAVLAALFGVVVILRPGFREVETGHLAMLGTAALTLQADGQNGSLRKTALTALAITWLNPHVYLDTVILLGSISTQYGAPLLFGLGCVLAAWVFFASLGFGAVLLRPLFAKPSAWRVLDALIALVMWAIAANLLFA